MASATLRMEKDCHPSVTTISQAVSRMLARTSSFCLSLRSVIPIFSSPVTFCNSVRQNYTLFYFHQIFFGGGGFLGAVGMGLRGWVRRRVWGITRFRPCCCLLEFDP